MEYCGGSGKSLNEVVSRGAKSIETHDYSMGGKRKARMNRRDVYYTHYRLAGGVATLRGGAMPSWAYMGNEIEAAIGVDGWMQTDMRWGSIAVQ